MTIIFFIMRMRTVTTIANKISKQQNEPIAHPLVQQHVPVDGSGVSSGLDEFDLGVGVYLGLEGGV